MEHKTIYRTNDPAGGNGYVTLSTVDGVSYPVTSNTRLIIDGEQYWPVRSEVNIITSGDGSVVTTITVVADDGS